MFRGPPVNPIRPNLPPLALANVVSPSAAPRSSEARSAAQKAFFELALGKTPAAVAAPTVAAPASAHAAAPLKAAARAAPEAPARPLRPGSLLDIRV